MNVRFKNFRCFEDTDDLELKKITFLVGENNSGKTSFLAGLNHICGLLDDDEDISLNSPPFELGSFKDICHSASFKQKSAIFQYKCQIGEQIFHWTFEDDHGVPNIKKYQLQRQSEAGLDQLQVNKSDLSITMKLSDGDRNILKGIGLKIELSKDEKHIITINNKRDEWPFSDIERQRSPMMIYRREIFNIERRIEHFWRTEKHEAKKQNNYSKTSLDRLFERVRALTYNRSRSPYFSRNREETIAIAPLRLAPQRVYSFGKPIKGNDPYGENLPFRLLKLNKSEMWESFSESLSEFGLKAGLFQKIDIKPLQEGSDYPFSIMVKTSEGQTSNLMDVGYGVSQILPLIFELLINDRGKHRYRYNYRYLMQQPEVHLHPRAQAEFASLIAKLSNNKNDFVIETHSDYMLGRLKFEIQQGTVSPNDIGILFFDNSEQQIKIHQIDIGKNGLPINAPPSYRRFFLQEMKKNWNLKNSEEMK